MKTAILSVASRDDVTRRARAAFKGEAQGSHISFRSVDLLWQTLTRKRLDILGVMTGAGPLAIREVARRVERDVKAVHGDVRALILAGVLGETPQGVLFPYDAVRVDFTLQSGQRTAAVA